MEDGFGVVGLNPRDKASTGPPVIAGSIAGYFMRRILQGMCKIEVVTRIAPVFFH